MDNEGEEGVPLIGQTLAAASTSSVESYPSAPGVAACGPAQPRMETRGAGVWSSNQFERVSPSPRNCSEIMPPMISIRRVAC